MTVQEWISSGQQYISALVPVEDILTDAFTSAHDGVHWYLELGVDRTSEERVTAWSYGLRGIPYPLHSDYHSMGMEDRSLLPLDLVNWLVGNF